MSLARRVAILSILIVIVGIFFGAYLILQNRGGDFAQFLMDRREGAGQTQPDKDATCKYKVEGQDLIVERKAHGHKNEHIIALEQSFLEIHTAGQNAVVETEGSLVIFNCINAEHLSHATEGDLSDPVSRVLASVSGRNVAAVGLIGGQEQYVEVFQFKTDKGQSAWNENFGPNGAGLTGPVVEVQLEGESLVVVLGESGKQAVHTYNFRRSHRKNPWNGHDQKEHLPFALSGDLVSGPDFSELGKKVQLITQEGDLQVTYEYNFSCKLEVPEGEENTKPCLWQEAD